MTVSMVKRLKASFVTLAKINSYFDTENHFVDFSDFTTPNFHCPFEHHLLILFRSKRGTKNTCKSSPTCAETLGHLPWVHRRFLSSYVKQLYTFRRTQNHDKIATGGKRESHPLQIQQLCCFCIWCDSMCFPCKRDWDDFWGPGQEIHHGYEDRRNDLWSRKCISRMHLTNKWLVVLQTTDTQFPLSQRPSNRCGSAETRMLGTPKRGCYTVDRDTAPC